MRLLAAPNSTPCNFTFSMMIRFNHRPDDLKHKDFSIELTDSLKLRTFVSDWLLLTSDKSKQKFRIRA